MYFRYLSDWLLLFLLLLSQQKGYSHLSRNCKWPAGISTIQVGPLHASRKRLRKGGEGG